MGNENGYKLWHMVVAFVLGVAVTGAAIMIPASGGQGLIAIKASPKVKALATYSVPTVSITNVSDLTGIQYTSENTTLLSFDVNVSNANLNLSKIEVEVVFPQDISTTPNLDEVSVPLTLKMGDNPIITTNENRDSNFNSVMKTIVITNPITLRNGSKTTFSINADTTRIVELTNLGDTLAVAVTKMWDTNNNLVFGKTPEESFGDTLMY